MNGTKIKMTMPLITEDDMSFIDNNLNSITKDFINKNIKDRDLALSQYIIKRQYEENEKLREKLNKIKNHCDKVPYDWSVCGIEVARKIEKILKEEVENE